MNKQIKSALISVFYKDGLEQLIKYLGENNVTIYSTGGTQKFIEEKGVKCIGVEKITNYPSILGGRVKTLHPSVFGGILGRRELDQDVHEMHEYKIPEIDLVIVDLYPFEQTLAEEKRRSIAEETSFNEQAVIEKIDVGGPSMIRAAAKNFAHVAVIASKQDYDTLLKLMQSQNGSTTIEQRKSFSANAFKVVMDYDIAISNYFNAKEPNKDSNTMQTHLRYGENPHQHASFTGDLLQVFQQLHGKELSYNNLVDVDAAIQLFNEFKEEKNAFFAVIKHTNVCGASLRPTIKESWDAALAGDPESAFGGVLITNRTIDKETATAISEIFFEVLIAPSFNDDALEILKAKKNRILLQLNKKWNKPASLSRTILNGTLTQDTDDGNYADWKEVGGRSTTPEEKDDLLFANIICKHLKSNAIAIVKNKQLVGKGCGQTSRIDALRQCVDKAAQFNFNLSGAVLASDAFFPFDDCVKLGDAAGVTAFIQPGGSIRDKDSIAYCTEKNLAMVLTGLRHFKH